MSAVAETKLVDLVAIRHRHAATTEGEWHLSENDGSVVNGKEQIAEVSTSDADACFMACAHQDVPAMAAEIEAWRTTFRAYDIAANVRPYDIAAANSAGDLYDALRALLPTT
jgi:hypothetical protein